MRYMMLIYHNEEQNALKSGAEQEAMMRDYFAFSNDMRVSGRFLNGEALHATHTATTVQLTADGKTTTADGPFDQTILQLGGFYILECEDLDDAIECASKIPDARDGAIEIRPLIEFE